MEPSPALVLHLNDLPVAGRDRLIALLSEHDLVAIQEDDITNPRVWTAHFADAERRDAAATEVRATAEFAHVTMQFAEVEDEDWARRTQADLPAVQVGRVIVCPPWDLRAPSSAGDVVVLIEPSRGFGTGHHQSTRLCLALLQHRNLTGLTVMDVGTGSGVLAITAAKLGAAYVAAVDNDPDAIDNARENIAANGVEKIVEAHVEDFISACRSPADVVTANLTGSLLARHAVHLAPLVRPQGTLIVAGFTHDEHRVVDDAFREAGFGVTESAEEDGWFAFVLTKNASPARAYSTF